MIIASNAFAYAKPSSKHDFSVKCNVYDKILGKQSTVQLIEKVEKLLRDRPCLGKMLDSTNDKDCIKIDVPRIRRIMGSSNFAQTSDIEELSKKWEFLKKQNV